MRSVLFLAVVALTACVDQTGEPATSSESAAATCTPGAAGCVTPDQSPVDWNPLGVFPYWPTGSIHTQRFSVNGDDDRTGHPTNYVFIVKNGTTVAFIYRVLKTDQLAFDTAYKRMADAMEQSHPGLYDIHSDGVFAGHGPRGPVGPGGKPLIPGWFIDDIATAAGRMGAIFNGINAEMDSKEWTNSVQ
jgi:hypothetical protein